MQYFQDLLALLDIEQAEDRLQYQKLTEKSGVQERRANGLSWYPVAIRGTELTKGDYVQVEVERTTHQDVSHILRFGMPAALFSNHDPKESRIEGIISHQSGNKLKINFRIDELPDWASDGKLGVDVLFDDNSYNEMRSALKAADKRVENSNETLLQVLVGEKVPTFHNEVLLAPVVGLNESQARAVQQIIAANELAIVHGPPGTGKTTTIVQAVKALIQQGVKKILVTAPSNTAVDLLTEKMAEQKISVLRIGNPARVTERLLAHTMDNQMAEHDSIKDVKRLKKQAQEFKNMAHKYKRNFGRAEQQQRKLLFDEAYKIMKEVERSEQYVMDDVIARAQVITATLVGANHYSVRNQQYDIAIIDEAGQALEPSCWIPILKAKKVVLAGDHCQLPPTIKSQEAAKGGLIKTLLEKGVEKHPAAVSLLEEQYRMHEHIMQFSSSIFYSNKLKANINVASRLLFANDMPLQFIDTAGCGFDEKLEGTSSTNPEEASFLIKHLLQLVTELNAHYPIDCFPSIGIIAPYKQQILVIKEQLEHVPELAPYVHRITVNTVDSFQGQERDIIYISMTRSNSEGEIGFLSDIRRMNVAMTRAKMKLIVIGDSATLAQFKFYEKFVTYAQSIDGYKSAWEYMG
ncbi:MAG: AAA family ATPase [Chitinophagales bacterium]|nr:AAA family ATPase [Chitinophagales bacterium]